MSVLYPVARNAEEAVKAPRAHAAREREAVIAAGAQVSFVTETLGPAHPTRDAASQAWSAALGREGSERVCALVERVSPGTRGKIRVSSPQKPVFRQGRRWPKPLSENANTEWRLQVSYWRIAGPEAAIDAAAQARAARKDPGAEGLSAQQLRAIAGAPLRPVKPQQPLDIGLFEARAPENPDLIIPDE